MVVIQYITDGEIGRVFGQTYRHDLINGGEEAFCDWFRHQTGYCIKGRMGEDDQIIGWLITFPTESDLVKFKLQWL